MLATSGPGSCFMVFDHTGMIVEYDQELLAPIGVVRDREQLRGRDVVVIEEGSAVMLVPREGDDPRSVPALNLLQVVVTHCRSRDIGDDEGMSRMTTEYLYFEQTDIERGSAGIVVPLMEGDDSSGVLASKRLQSLFLKSFSWKRSWE